MRKSHFSFFAAPAVAATLVMAAIPAFAHGDDNEMPFGQPGKPSQVTRTVKVDMKNMRFTPDKLQVREGETIRFVVSNQDQVPHELVIGDMASQMEHRKEMSGMMNMGMKMEHKDPNAVSMEPGEQKNLIWTFTKAGNLEFDCNVPGHYEAGMKGDISVVAK